MKQLVYGVVRAAGDWGLLPAGPQGGHAELLHDGELAAACSVVPEACASPSVNDLMAYAQVIDHLHGQGPVLPMRFGCLLEHDSQVIDLLRVRHGHFLAALREVEGCDEFGLRVLVGSRAPEVHPVCTPAMAAPGGTPSGGPGTRYLADRRTRYAEKDTQCQQAAAALERFREAFDGVFVHCEQEPTVEAAPILSLHFLVRRENHDRFYTTFRRLQQGSTDKLLLTGPWPPYHFAAASRANPLALATVW